MSGLDSKKQHIRYQFDEKTNNWYYSIVDIIGIIAETSDPRNYWKVLKNRLKKAQNQLVTDCNQLKMLASDGKYYLTDVGNKETILKMIKLASPLDLPYFEDYFDKLEHEKKLKIVPKREALSALSHSKKNTYPQIKVGERKFFKKVKMKTI